MCLFGGSRLLQGQLPCFQEFLLETRVTREPPAGQMLRGAEGSFLLLLCVGKEGSCGHFGIWLWLMSLSESLMSLSD